MGRRGTNQATSPQSPTRALTESSPGASSHRHQMTASPTAVRSQIKRGRTGCFTCRRRRKKCDETKPECIGCIRAGYICEGYPDIVRFEGNKPRRSSQSRPAPAQNQLSSPPDNSSATTAILQDATVAAADADTFMDWFLPDDSVPDFTGMNDLSSFNIFSPLEGAMMVYPEMTPVFPPQTYTSQQSNLELELPRSIPFLIGGVDSQIEQKFFYHFTNVTSRVLTICNDEKNPLLTVVLPRSLDDPMIAKAISCLGGSHLVNLQPEAETRMKAEKQRLFRDALDQQTVRLQRLRATKTLRTSSEVEAILASTLLLCLYEISEGSGNISWKLRLNEARELIQTALQSAMPAAQCAVHAVGSIGVNQFLLDFFAYHDILAGVTDATREPVLGSAIRASQTQDDAYMMIGADNGLFGLIAKIATLRANAITNGRKNVTVICEAIRIWEELDAWKPDTDDKDQRLAFSAYSAALFVWLYSIIYPDKVADDKVQTCIRQGLDDMQQIQASGVLAFLLFPAFVFGFASVLSEQRAEVSAVFDRLSGFSGLGNVRLARDLVKTSWLDHGTGCVRSWDWMQQMQANGISVPVT
ncbi:DNA-binding transcriptional regulator ume6 [Exophiala xenobiotica]|nr:DNA-binding transcriptional regulator ume6 [Exophiala xenobiotica]